MRVKAWPQPRARPRNERGRPADAPAKVCTPSTPQSSGKTAARCGGRDHKPPKVARHPAPDTRAAIGTSSSTKRCPRLRSCWSLPAFPSNSRWRDAEGAERSPKIRLATRRQVRVRQTSRRTTQTGVQKGCSSSIAGRATRNFWNLSPNFAVAFLPTGMATVIPW